MMLKVVVVVVVVELYLKIERGRGVEEGERELGSGWVGMGIEWEKCKSGGDCNRSSIIKLRKRLIKVWGLFYL